MNGEPVKTAKIETKGCAIAMPERDKKQAHAKISYAKSIAPMLIDNCVACHRTGGIGPWQMSSYDMIKGFAPMIREVVRTQRMPPWHADPHYQAFSNDRSLSKDEVKTLVHWIEAGAPRGSGNDPLVELKRTWPEWALGEPDLIVEIPAFDVPATGTIPYQMPSTVRIRSIMTCGCARSTSCPAIAPCSITSSRTMGVDGAGIRDGGSLGGYVPGAGPMVLPQETGVLLKKGAKFFFQMHYTATGKQARDVTPHGPVLPQGHAAVPVPQRRDGAASLKIPPNTKAHTESASRTFEQDALIYSLQPHSHFRGKASNFVATYPDGTRGNTAVRAELRLQLADDVRARGAKTPAGRHEDLAQHDVCDNSTQNKANPDPNREVPWGEQTWDEMVYGVVRFRYIDENSAPKETVSRTRE